MRTVRKPISAIDASVRNPNSRNHTNVHDGPVSAHSPESSAGRHSMRVCQPEIAAPIAAIGTAYQRTSGSRRSAPTSRIGASGYIAMRWNQHSRHGLNPATSEK
jgi:hypothetical protein